MDARLTRAFVLAAALASLGASYRTQNFVVTTTSPRLAQRIGQLAEQYRQQLAVEWLGQQLPDWQSPCPITAHVAPHLGAGGATSFTFQGRQVGNWQMNIQGSEQRLLDSVLPHEVTHTIFATHFRQPLPRWADEGACTTVEHPTEKMRHQQMLIRFLQTNRGIAFSRMFAMKEYPSDMLPLYAEGYSLARYLIEQGGKRKFVAFVGDGLRDENWTRAMHQNYGYENLALLQDRWLDWVRKGSPSLLPSPAAQPGTPAVLAGHKRPRPDQPNLRLFVARQGAATAGRALPPGTPAAARPGVAPGQVANNADTAQGWRGPGQRMGNPIRNAGSARGTARQQPPQQPQQRVLQ